VFGISDGNVSSLNREPFDSLADGAFSFRVLADTLCRHLKRVTLTGHLIL
jgi:hypothetical protein